jgi:hypothetical protein
MPGVSVVVDWQPMPTVRERWTGSPARGRLLALYAEVDALVQGLSCACSEGGVGATDRAQCCNFGVTGREPYPTAVELEEVRHALRASPPPRPGPAARAAGASGAKREREPARLPLADLRPCPLLSEGGRCRIYASRPFGCRTFFCDQKVPRDAINAIGRRIADLSAQFAPRDPGPRPLVRALASDLGNRSRP